MSPCCGRRARRGEVSDGHPGICVSRRNAQGLAGTGRAHRGYSRPAQFQLADETLPSRHCSRPGGRARPRPRTVQPGDPAAADAAQGPRLEQPTQRLFGPGAVHSLRPAGSHVPQHHRPARRAARLRRQQRPSTTPLGAIHDTPHGPQLAARHAKRRLHLRAADGVARG